MNISVKADYAIQAILDLSMQPAGEPVRIADIAARQKIPQKFLELILASLKQGGFVESRRGAEGGYLLSRSPDNIMVGEVMNYVDGARSRVAADRGNADTPFAEMWRRVNEAVSSVVDQTSFGELSRKWLDKQTKYVPNWEI
ncbi:MAG TPA: Rrf2 family transcriptional regulator [Bryobacteraceae bacterium]|nr:Rrf2 family transcriptional regulator [Bryobacteraceae bacterium]